MFVTKALVPSYRSSDGFPMDSMVSYRSLLWKYLIDYLELLTLNNERFLNEYFFSLRDEHLDMYY